jgi:hypothetical protein
MPPRHTYWTIIFGGQPTAFRSATREDLLPTFRQIQAKHPDATMVWFARGRIWKSEEEAREALLRSRRPRPDPRYQREPRTPRPDQHDSRTPWPGQRDRRGPRPDQHNPRARRPDQRDPRSDQRDPRAPRPRTRDWRPGGTHQDPRQQFKVPRDVKRARFKAKARRDRMYPRPPKKKDDE